MAISATTLTSEDLGVLKRLLQPVAAYWVAIADQLGMESLESVIRGTPSNINPPACLRDLLNRWLNQGHPTLKALCKALQDDPEIIGGAGVATKLEEEFQSRRGFLPSSAQAAITLTGKAPSTDAGSGSMSTDVSTTVSAPVPTVQSPAQPSSSLSSGQQQSVNQTPPTQPQQNSQIATPSQIQQPLDDRPTLRNLKKFPNKHGETINIPLQIGTNYRTFGTFLLKDDNGAIVSGIEKAKMHNAEEINEAILMRWISGKGQQPFTWDTLVTCLRDTELITLASDIEEALQMPSDRKHPADIIFDRHPGYAENLERHRLNVSTTVSAPVPTVQSPAQPSSSLPSGQQHSNEATASVTPSTTHPSSTHKYVMHYQASSRDGLRSTTTTSQTQGKSKLHEATLKNPYCPSWKWYGGICFAVVVAAVLIAVTVKLYPDALNNLTGIEPAVVHNSKMSPGDLEQTTKGPPLDCHRISNKQDLRRAVASIGDWETLCENLGAPEPVLKQLRFDSIPNEMKRSRCLEAYLNTGKACWETVVQVVADLPFYNEKLAKKVANEHGVDYSSIVKDEL